VTDKTAIFNMALSVAGSRSLVQSWEEDSREAELARVWYDQVRKQILAAGNWSGAKRTARLALVAEFPTDGEWVTGSPEPGWQYSYALPSDFIRPRYLSDYGRFSLAMRTNEQRVLMTNGASPLLVYTADLDNPETWEEYLSMAIIHGLGAYLANGLSGKSSKVQFAEAKANQMVLESRVISANEDYRPVEVLPDWIAARGYGNESAGRYIYPWGPFLSVSALGS
jgi:hypothetical protein